MTWAGWPLRALLPRGDRWGWILRACGSLVFSEGSGPPGSKAGGHPLAVGVGAQPLKGSEKWLLASLLCRQRRGLSPFCREAGAGSLRWGEPRVRGSVSGDFPFPSTRPSWAALDSQVVSPFQAPGATTQTLGERQKRSQVW